MLRINHQQKSPRLLSTSSSTLRRPLCKNHLHLYEKISLNQTMNESNPTIKAVAEKQDR